MNMIGRKIYPAHDAWGIDYDPSEWRLLDGAINV
jgi:hypothetical protein